MEKIVTIPDQHANSIKNQEEPENLTKQNQTFILSKELEKVKIEVPLLELVKTPGYKKEIADFINLSQSDEVGDIVNLQEEKPVVTFGPHVEEVDSSIPPFYISVLLHDFILHNCMLDSGASHNLMPLSMMKELNLKITKPYRDLYSFDSKMVKCVGLIKDMVVSLAQIPARIIMMDVVVADIPARCCCLDLGRKILEEF